MNLFLIGPRGSGKSTVGRLLADPLQLPFHDLDEVIERNAGKSIAAIFASEGEDAFRDQESVALAQVSGVIATGGGVILREENRKHLKSTGWTVYLKAEPETLLARITLDPTTLARRPCLTSLSGIDEVRAILAQRETLYRQAADLVVECSTLSPIAVSDTILAAWRCQHRDATCSKDFA